MTLPKLHPFTLFPKASDRAPWRAVAENLRFQAFRDDIARQAETAMTSPIPYLSPIRYMDFVRNGDRGRYELDYFARRRHLEALVISEALEYKGRYLERIVEYLDAILSEYTWCLPAHTRQSDPLPFFEDELIDLFSAETASYLTQTLVVLEDDLAAISPNLVKRMRTEIIRRDIVPIEKDITRFWWHHGLNNWTPWICSNILWNANTVLADAPERLQAIAEILVDSVTPYAEKYSEDGCSPEGPGYWNLSPTRFFLLEEALSRASDNAYKSPIEEKLFKMCQYISDIWMGKTNFALFEDNGGRHAIQYGLVRAMARRTGCTKTIDFINQFEKARPMVTIPHTGFICTLLALFTPYDDVPPAGDFLAKYPVRQQFFARNGRYHVAVRGGSNGDPHNHNDVGQFTFAIDGDPVIVDPGSAQYTKQSFGTGRYAIWTMNSTAHNAIIFNGVGQAPGGNFHAEGVVCDGSPEHFTVTMELAHCYPESLSLKSYRRVLEYTNGTLAVTDTWQAGIPLEPTLTLYHPIPEIPLKTNASTTTEHVDTTDPWLFSNWKDSLYKTTLTMPKAQAGTITLTI